MANMGALYSRAQKRGKPFIGDWCIVLLVINDLKFYCSII
jgi:hypothetical protein